MKRGYIYIELERCRGGTNRSVAPSSHGVLKTGKHRRQLQRSSALRIKKDLGGLYSFRALLSSCVPPGVYLSERGPRREMGAAGANRREIPAVDDVVPSASEKRSRSVYEGERWETGKWDIWGEN